MENMTVDDYKSLISREINSAKPKTIEYSYSNDKRNTFQKIRFERKFTFNLDLDSDFIITIYLEKDKTRFISFINFSNKFIEINHNEEREPMTKEKAIEYAKDYLISRLNNTK